MIVVVVIAISIVVVVAITDVRDFKSNLFIISIKNWQVFNKITVFHH